jgi:aminomethyltransferase
VTNRTPFYDLHLKAHAKMVDFAGWEMPLHYGSQLDEHHQVRQHAGFFDVSHMGIVDIDAKDATRYLRFLLANDVERLSINKALYTCMLNEKGGVIDDLIVYKLGSDYYRLIINAGTRDKDLAWFLQVKDMMQAKVNITLRKDLVMLAVQGPYAKEVLSKIFPDEEAASIQALKPFSFTQFKDFFVSRTGYTGEDGFEFIFPETLANSIWQRLINAGLKPCGLGARDTLRLEAGLNLYGSDMDETVSPLESNLAWTVIFDPKERKFIGREALEAEATQGVKRRLVGLVLEGPGIIRNHQKISIVNDGKGEVTSGGYSPTLEKSIALARVPSAATDVCFVEIRQKQVKAKIVKPPFVRHGKQIF